MNYLEWQAAEQGRSLNPEEQAVSDLQTLANQTNGLTLQADQVERMHAWTCEDIDAANERGQGVEEYWNTYGAADALAAAEADADGV